MSHSPDRAAPSHRPNLEQKRKLAKQLLKAVKRLDSSEAARFTWNLQRFRGSSGQDVIREGVTLADAQHVIARESGFESWPKLTQYVRTLECDPNGPVSIFEDAVRAIIRGDVAELGRLLGRHPELATMRSTRHHGALLPHYIAANGVENEHQFVPANAPDIAKTLFDAGGDAIIDATAGFYGGGGGSTPLIALVTSSHPHDAGVQAALVRLFCQAGAKVDGIDDDCMPLTSALGFRYPAAAAALGECGARIDNLPAAAGLGRIDLVRRFLDETAQLASEECVFPNPGHVVFARSTAPHPAAMLAQALVFACMSGHVAVAELLIEHGTAVNAGPRSKITALHESCYQGQWDVVRLLLARGGDPTLRDTMWHSTAIGWACGGKQPKIIEELFRHERIDICDAVELQRYEIVRRLLETDPSLADAPTSQGGALRHAAFKGDAEMVSLLLEFGASPSLRNVNGFSALDYATKAGHSKILALLRAED